MAEVDKSEKITINVGLVDLGQIDLLVDEGFYANRTDFIRTAIRRQLETRAGAGLQRALAATPGTARSGWVPAGSLRRPGPGAVLDNGSAVLRTGLPGRRLRRRWGEDVAPRPAQPAAGGETRRLTHSCPAGS